MRRAALLLLAAVLLPAPMRAQEDPDMAKALRVLSRTPLIDGHNDLPWAIRESETAPHDVASPRNDLRGDPPFMTDIARLRKGRVGGQFWSVYIPYESVDSGAARVQLEQIDIAKQIIARYPDVFEEADDASDVERIFGEGKIASMIGMEGGHAIENSLGALRAFYDMGVRYMTLTHNGTLDWADAANDEHRHGGLTPFGMEVVREMNRLGMLVDLSHTSPETMNDALDVSEAPVIWSHADARALHDVPRNVPDEVLRRLPDNGGVVMVTFVPSLPHRSRPGDGGRRRRPHRARRGGRRHRPRGDRVGLRRHHGDARRAGGRVDVPEGLRGAEPPGVERGGPGQARGGERAAGDARGRGGGAQAAARARAVDGDHRAAGPAERRH